MVQEIVTEDTSVKSNHFKASEDNPKVRVKSEKSGKEVRLEALRWTAAVSCQQQSQSSLLSFSTKARSMSTTFSSLSVVLQEVHGYGRL
jgi:hypothetical protein